MFFSRKNRLDINNQPVFASIIMRNQDNQTIYQSFNYRIILSSVGFDPQKGYRYNMERFNYNIELDLNHDHLLILFLQILLKKDGVSFAKVVSIE